MKINLIHSTLPLDKNRANKYLLFVDIISALLLLLFLYTSLSKLEDYKTFSIVLYTSPIIKPVAGVIAWLLPVTELLIVALLFIPFMRLKGLYASLFLITLFTLYLIYMVVFTPDLPCNCGAAIQALTWPQHIFFNLFFILLSALGIYLYHRGVNKRSSPPP